MSSKTVFILSVSLFLLHQLAQKLMNINFEPADNYLDPLLLMPILLHLIKMERQWLLKRKYTFRFWEIILWTVSISIITEYFFPKWNNKFTADYIDVLLYFAGVVIYYFADEQTINKRMKPGK